jgi:hypothetical protein
MLWQGKNPITWQLPRRFILYLFASSNPCGYLDVGWLQDLSVVERLHAATIATSAGKSRTIGE